jgi:hypothetical protein
MADNQDTHVELKDESTQLGEPDTQQDRRKVVQNLGKFAAYAAPFTLLALTKKANAASAHGPSKHP